MKRVSSAIWPSWQWFPISYTIVISCVVALSLLQWWSNLKLFYLSLKTSLLPQFANSRKQAHSQKPQVQLICSKVPSQPLHRTEEGTNPTSYIHLAAGIQLLLAMDRQANWSFLCKMSKRYTVHFLLLWLQTQCQVAAYHISHILFLSIRKTKPNHNKI